jgi:hypothetical protein
VLFLGRGEKVCLARMSSLTSCPCFSYYVKQVILIHSTFYDSSFIEKKQGKYRCEIFGEDVGRFAGYRELFRINFYAEVLQMERKSKKVKKELSKGEILQEVQDKAFKYLQEFRN